MNFSDYTQTYKRFFAIYRVIRINLKFAEKNPRLNFARYDFVPTHIFPVRGTISIEKGRPFFPVSPREDS
jgi:hypothetical protein